MTRSMLCVICVTLIPLCFLSHSLLAQGADVHIESISFNYDGSSAVTILDHRTGLEIAAPEIVLGSNQLTNPGAESGAVGWNTYGSPTIGEADGNHYFMLETEGSHFVQDINLLSYAQVIDGGGVNVTVSGIVKAQRADVHEGFPYLYGYLMGREGMTNRINTYMTTGAVHETGWTYVEMSYPVPAHTRKIRVFLNRSSVRGYDDENVAFFDNISVKLLLPGEPSAHIKSSPVSVKVKFAAQMDLDEIAVWATGDMGGVNSSAAPVSVALAPEDGQPYKTGEAIFNVNSPPAAMGKNHVTWNWKYRKTTDPAGIFKNIGTSRHLMYHLMATPIEPMETPWKEVLEYACTWSHGETEILAAATGIRSGLHYIGDRDGDVDYDPDNFYLGEPVDRKQVLLLSNFFRDLELRSQVMINCFDSAHLLATFCRAVGLNMERRFIGYHEPPEGCYMFRTNYIDPIGNGSFLAEMPPEDWGTTTWTGHVINHFNDGLYDACLNLDGLDPVIELPCSILVPVNMDWETYKMKLVNPEPAEGPYFPLCQDVNIHASPGDGWICQ